MTSSMLYATEKLSEAATRLALTSGSFQARLSAAIPYAAKAAGAKPDPANDDHKAFMKRLNDFLSRMGEVKGLQGAYQTTISSMTPHRTKKAVEELWGLFFESLRLEG